MNDYSFGNYLYELRKAAGLSQSQAARLLELSDKAVSKWENGKAKPTTEALRRLSALYRVPVEELLRRREARKEPAVTKIVLTGGPGAGKTTGQSWIQNCFTKQGYTVLFVPETATELMGGGVKPALFASPLDFQRAMLRLQLEKERVFEEAARCLRAEKVLLVCDRGAMDNKAYMSEVDFARLLQELGLNEVQLRDRYDAVFHLTTAAKGARRFYTTDNNPQRSETPDEAVVLDDKLIAAWTGHPHLRVVENAEDFEDKLRTLVAEISAFLGEPEPLEIERKFLIQYPDLRWLESLPNCRKVDIIQTYLLAQEGDELRVRQRGENGSYIYFKALKRRLSDEARVELEERLDEKEYLRLLMKADPKRRPIRKTRYCLTWEGQYFEIDVYPFWKDKAIVEIELREEGQEIRFPRELKLIREVTADPAYKNASLALRDPEPEIEAK